MRPVRPIRAANWRRVQSTRSAGPRAACASQSPNTPNPLQNYTPAQTKPPKPPRPSSAPFFVYASSRPDKIPGALDPPQHPTPFPMRPVRPIRTANWRRVLCTRSAGPRAFMREPIPEHTEPTPKPQPCTNETPKPHHLSSALYRNLILTPRTRTRAPLNSPKFISIPHAPGSTNSRSELAARAARANPLGDATH